MMFGKGGNGETQAGFLRSHPFRDLAHCQFLRRRM